MAQSLCQCVTVTVPAAVRRVRASESGAARTRTLVDSGRDGARAAEAEYSLLVVSFMCVLMSVSGLLD